MPPIDLTVPFLIFYGVPTAILVIGAILAFIQQKYRRIIGVFLGIIGTLELSIYLLYRGFVPTLIVLYYIMAITAIIGVISIFILAE